MEVFEVGNNIASIWNIFFWPFIEFLIITLVVYFLVGKELWNHVKKNLFVKRDNIVFRRRKGIYLPLSTFEKQLIEYLKSSSLLVLVIVLVLIYATQKIVHFVANLIPITYYFRGDQILLTINDDIISSIWSYCPNLPFIELYNKIQQLAETGDAFQYDTFTSNFYNAVSLFEFLFILGIITIIVPQVRKHLKCIKKALLLIAFSFIFTIIAYECQFSHFISQTEQKAYYALTQYQLEGDSEAAAKEKEACLAKLKLLHNESNRDEPIIGFTLKYKIDMDSLKYLLKSISFN